ncbi:MAG: hypothetical protein GX425_11385 [Peptococcaceae bacterium]|nr:hypothetical protein [Peptococcaceae bacterium]
MINLLREVLNDIVICIDTGDYPAVMRETVCFTVLFEQFLRQSGVYIFNHEVESLNRCLSRMLACLDRNELDDLREVIVSSFRNFLDSWDFNNKKSIN